MAELGASLDETAWKAPSECPGWSVQDNLVHITALERFILGDPLPIGGRARRPAPREERHRPLQRALDRVAPCLVRRRCPGGVRRHHRRPHRPAPRARRRRASPPTRGRRWARAPSRSSSAFRIFDSWVHEQDMRRGLERPGDLDSDAARFSTQMMLDVLPYVVGKKVGAPDGSTVVLTLTGPIVSTTAVGTTDGRARPLDPVPDVPTVSLSLASDVYARLACGRRRPRRGAGHRASSRSTATSTSAVRSCTSSTTCSEPRTPRLQSEHRWIWSPTSSPAATPIASCCSCTGTAPTSATSVACSATSTPTVASPRCCPGAPSRRRPGSRGSTWPRRSPTTSPTPSPTALAAVDDLLDAACAEHGFERAQAVVGGFSQGGGLALALGARPVRAHPARGRAGDEPVRAAGPRSASTSRVPATFPCCSSTAPTTR